MRIIIFFLSICLVIPFCAQAQWFSIKKKPINANKPAQQDVTIGKKNTLGVNMIFTNYIQISSAAEGSKVRRYLQPNETKYSANLNFNWYYKRNVNNNQAIQIGVTDITRVEEDFNSEINDYIQSKAGFVTIEGLYYHKCPINDNLFFQIGDGVYTALQYSNLYIAERSKPIPVIISDLAKQKAFTIGVIGDASIHFKMKKNAVSAIGLKTNVDVLSYHANEYISWGPYFSISRIF